MSHTAANPRSQNSSPPSTERNDYYDPLPFKGSHHLKYIQTVSAVSSLHSLQAEHLAKRSNKQLSPTLNQVHDSGFVARHPPPAAWLGYGYQRRPLNAVAVIWRTAQT